MIEYNLELYKDPSGEHRCRFVHKNSNIIFAPTEGYANLNVMLEILKRAAKALVDGEYNLIDLTKEE